MFILRSSPASPFVRKVIIAADRLGLSEQIKIENSDVRDPNDSIRSQNPLGKIPALILPDGDVLYDSRVIVEYLDALAGGGKVIPHGAERFKVLRNQSLADGIMDAALLHSYELRFRTPEQRSDDWISNQQSKVERALQFASKHLVTPINPSNIDIGQIALACALGYLDLRHQGQWRAGYPELVSWLTEFTQYVPMYGKTDFKG